MGDYLHDLVEHIADSVEHFLQEEKRKGLLKDDIAEIYRVDLSDYSLNFPQGIQLVIDDWGEIRITLELSSPVGKYYTEKSTDTDELGDFSIELEPVTVCHADHHTENEWALIIRDNEGKCKFWRQAATKHEVCKQLIQELSKDSLIEHQSIISLVKKEFYK